MSGAQPGLFRRASLLIDKVHILIIDILSIWRCGKKWHKNTPYYLLGKISDVLRELLYHMELPEEKVEDTVAKVKERKMGMLFENIKINIPAEKRKAEAALQEQEVIRQELEICKHILNMTRNGHSDEEITKSLMQQFSLDAEQAREMLATY